MRFFDGLAYLVAVVGIAMMVVLSFAWSPPQLQVDGGPPATSCMVTRVYDGHWWVISTSSRAFAHHPDCPQCKRRRILEEPADGQ
jgi:hypothetical protein